DRFAPGAEPVSVTVPPSTLTIAERPPPVASVVASERRPPIDTDAPLSTSSSPLDCAPEAARKTSAAMLAAAPDCTVRVPPPPARPIIAAPATIAGGAEGDIVVATVEPAPEIANTAVVPEVVPTSIAPAFRS